jgi:hypothetical protein
MNISNISNLILDKIRSFTHFNPVRDWFVLLTVSLFALVIIIVWNVWTFDIVANGGIIGSSATSTSPVFNQSSLDAIQTIFSKRAEEEAKYLRGVYRFADPSQSDQ